MSAASRHAVSTAAPAERREIISPEGVPLFFETGQAGARAMAFSVDLILIFVILILIRIGASILSVAGQGVGAAFGTVLWFLVANLYFAWFEIRWLGSTPGKRLLGLRVVDRSGGALTATAVFTRNFMREVEFWMPFRALAVSMVELQLVGDPSLGISGLLLALLWSLALLCFPLFNRDRMRLGDLLAGTMVVTAPKVSLLGDLAAKPSARKQRTGPEFRRSQLEIYGIYELQVLEDVLRAKDRSRMERVRRRIEKKIGWEGDAGIDDQQFLRAFYRAQRARLEEKMVLGNRQERKRE